MPVTAPILRARAFVSGMSLAKKWVELVRPRGNALSENSTDGWMRTGDLGYLTAEGNIVVAGGRLRDMIIRGGENIYPVEIENMLRAHPAVSDIAVFAVPDHYYGEIVGAAITLAADTTAEELHAYCNGRIAKFKVPARFYRVAEFPLTASGKIRKTELRDMSEAETLTRLE